MRPGRPWSLPLEDRALLVKPVWRTDLTARQLNSWFGISKSAADRIIDQVGPLLALRPRLRFAKDTVLIVDGTLVPTRDHTVAEQSKNYGYYTNHQVVIDADTRRTRSESARGHEQRGCGHPGSRVSSPVHATLPSR